MSRQHHFAASAVFLLACSGPTAVDSTPVELEDPADVTASTSAADSALTAAKAELVEDPDFAASIGLTETATLDVSMTRLFVRIDELQAWTSEKPVGSLFHAVGIRMFMVLEGERVVSAMVMGKNDDGTWRVISQGHKTHAPRIAAARAQSIEALGQPSTPMYIIQVPALYAEFVSQRVDDTLYLTPTMDVGDLPAGTPVAARDVIVALQAMPARATSRTD